MRIPMMFMQYRLCTPENGLTPNLEGVRSNPNGPGHGPYRLTFVVFLPTCNDERFYNSTWMNDPHLLTDGKNGHYVTQFDVDLVGEEDKYVFDSDDMEQSRREAITKMKQLWSELEVT
jgi:hypothetical protein